MAVWEAARPRHWLKNVLVLAAPGAAGVLHHPAVAARVGLAFVCFCLAASGSYLLNDVVDADADRRHPHKRHRPVAAGRLSLRTATTTGVVSLVAGLGLSAPLGSLALTATLAAYVALALAYSLGLKHVAVADIAVVAGGYFLRAAAGGFAAGVPLSEWFLIVTGFGALFLVGGKRHVERAHLGEERAAHRPALASYPPLFTEHVLTVSATVTVLAYCLWAFDTQAAGLGAPWLAISIVPFTVAFLRHAQLVFRGEGGDPVDVVLRDRGLIVAGAVWAAVLLVGIYGVGDVG